MADIEIALHTRHTYTQSIWVATGATVPTTDMLRRTCADWLERYCEDPLRTSLRTWLEAHPLDIRVNEVGRTPAPALTALRQAGATETEEGRLSRATHEITVSASDLHEPRLALWNVLAASRAIALQHAGIVLDRDVPRLVPIRLYTRRIESGVRVADHVTILSIPQREGRAHLVLRGLKKFQLPLIQIDYVAADLQPQTALVLQLLAQVLVHRARRQLAATPLGSSTRLIVPAQTRIDLDHEALRRIAWKIDTQPNAKRAVVAHLSYVPASAAQEATLRLEPPPGFRGDPRNWIAPLLAELLGGQITEITESEAARAAQDPMQAATEKARAELPELKRRFQKGLPGGHDVYVKRGFPLPDGSKEFMWIHVASWYDGLVRGRLATHPRHRTDLHAGQTLQCAEDDVIDWLLIFPDGREMGGYTDQVPQTRKVPRPIPF